jgi:metal-responsive CopG/Arc/MetJ family transcriptional regulator
MTLRIIVFKADEDLIIKMDAYAMNHRMYRSEVIRLALQKFLKEELEKETIPKARVEKIMRLK